MGVPKIKSLVIAALVLINAFFLTFIIKDNSDDARFERQAVENICAVLESGGIMVSPDDVAAGGSLRAMRASRGLGAEGVIADTFLGPAVMTDQGNIYHYESDRGTASFYIGGDFEISLNEDVVVIKGGALRTARRLLRDMRIEISEISVSGSLGNETVTAVCAYKKTSIFNCPIEFVFSGGSLKTVKGRYMTGIEPSEDGVEILSAGTALLRFFAAVRDGEWECSRIDGVEAGYQSLVAGSFGDGIVAPAWLITADTGRYVINDATGEIRVLP